MRRINIGTLGGVLERYRERLGETRRSELYTRATRRKDLVKEGMQELTAGCQADKHEFAKGPVIAGFLGFPEYNAATLRGRIERLRQLLPEVATGRRCRR